MYNYYYCYTEGHAVRSICLSPQPLVCRAKSRRRCRGFADDARVASRTRGSRPPVSVIMIIIIVMIIILLIVIILVIILVTILLVIIVAS